MSDDSLRVFLLKFSENIKKSRHQINNFKKKQPTQKQTKKPTMKKCLPLRDAGTRGLRGAVDRYFVAVGDR